MIAFQHKLFESFLWFSVATIRLPTVCVSNAHLRILEFSLFIQKISICVREI